MRDTTRSFLARQRARKLVTLIMLLAVMGGGALVSAGARAL